MLLSSEIRGKEIRPQESPIAPIIADAVKRRPKLRAICLFSSAGIGELGVEEAGISIACANEIVPYRVALYRENFPKHEIVEGDIWEKVEEIENVAARELRDDELFLVYATPPCQGMSTNGIGKLKRETNEGRRHSEDARNRLIIPAMALIKRLRPRWVLLENVPGMQNTVIREEDGKEIRILDFVARELGNEYLGEAEVVSCDAFGIPQRRKRLITIFTREPGGKEYFRKHGGTFFGPELREQRRTLRDAIGNLPELDAVPGKNERLDFHPYHYVNPIKDEKRWWIANTPEGETAFNNQCANQACLFGGNGRHRDESADERRAGKKNPIPVTCEKCGSLLPRPVVREKDGSVRLLRGFHSAYRRMRWDEPAHTLTQNFIYEASDNKIHPTQNRVLSVLEALTIQTISRYKYRFEISGQPIGTARIAEVIGESVPPYLIEKICRMMTRVST